LTVETATYISDLNTALPAAGDLKSEGDDHLRLIKTVTKATFPNVTGAVTKTHTDINNLGDKGLKPASVTTGAFVAADAGLCVYATGAVTIPNSTMAANDVVMILNTTASPIIITASITTLRLAGTTSTGTRSLAAYGFASVIFTSSTLAFITGAGLS
jgi:hypothetical protein